MGGAGHALKDCESRPFRGIDDAPRSAPRLSARAITRIVGGLFRGIDDTPRRLLCGDADGASRVESA